MTRPEGSYDGTSLPVALKLGTAGDHIDWLEVSYHFNAEINAWSDGRCGELGIIISTIGDHESPQAVAIQLLLNEQGEEVTFTSDPKLIPGHRDDTLMPAYPELRAIILASQKHDENNEGPGAGPFRVRIAELAAAATGTAQT